MIHISKNEGMFDRGIRLFLAGVFFLGGFFWFGGVVQIVLIVLSFVLLATAVVGFCGIYTLLGVRTCPIEPEPLSKVTRTLLALLFIFVLLGGAYASVFFSKKIFLEDYAEMNQYYKQALFFTGQEKREEAVANYTELVSAYEVFQTKYIAYHPYVLRRDPQFNGDLERISAMIALPKEKVMSGDLKSAHLDLEKVRPVFQDILKRNGFSMLAITLVEFHDVMEKIITASDEKNSALVIATYPLVSDKLREVEVLANDLEIQAIRQNLEQLLVHARDREADKLPAKAAELKSSFVKVYLKRG